MEKKQMFHKAIIKIFVSICMGIKRFLLFLRNKTHNNVSLLDKIFCNQFNHASVAVDANNYFYKFLATEVDSLRKIEEIFCILTSGTHDTTALVLINHHLGQCETTSERHLLRCLYIFCYFCHTSLRLRHLLFVIDGAAPHIKTGELAERKQQKRLAYGKVLHERRTLLLHRIYALRWYQLASITFALYENYSNFSTNQSIKKQDAVAKLLQNAFEWALGTQVPDQLVTQKLHLLSVSGKEDALCDLYSKLRISVQTSFLVEFDCANSHFYCLDFYKFFESLLAAIIQSDRNAVTKMTPKPFLLCLHLNETQEKLVAPLLFTHEEAILRCWNNCASTFLLCTIIHRQSHKKPVVGFPRNIERDYLSEWQCKASEYWCHEKNFSHRHQHIWRDIKYAEWLCSEKSSEWLCNAYQSGPERELYYYQVPKQYSQCYDTQNDASHHNLDWTDDAMQLFSNLNLPIAWELPKNHAPLNQVYLEENSDVSQNEMQQDDNYVSNFHDSKDSLLEQKQQHHKRFRIRDNFLQITVRFLRVVCGTPVIVAEHEAEATCAKLCRDKVCDFVFTDDVDALAFGSPNIVLDWPDIVEIGKWQTLMGGTLEPKFSAKVVFVDNILRHFHLSWEDLTLWCIFCGTDFMRVGDSKFSVAMALRVIQKFTSIEKRVEQLEEKNVIEQGSLQIVLRVYDFFRQNQILPQSEFLARQFAPKLVDETLRLQEICASRKLS